MKTPFLITLPSEKNGKCDAHYPGEMGAEFNLH